MDESGRKWNNPADVLNVVSAQAEPDISTGVWMCDAGLVVCMLATTRVTALHPAVVPPQFVGTNPPVHG
jgi:hypothetical protein